MKSSFLSSFFFLAELARIQRLPLMHGDNSHEPHVETNMLNFASAIRKMQIVLIRVL